MAVEDVERKIDMVEEELSDATSRQNPDKLTELIDHFSDSVLHPNHYLLMLAKRNYICLVKKARIKQLASAEGSDDSPAEKDEYQESLCNSFKQDLTILKRLGWGA